MVSDGRETQVKYSGHIGYVKHCPFLLMQPGVKVCEINKNDKYVLESCFKAGV